MSDTKTFEIEVRDGVEAADVLTRAREAARGAGIALNGDDAGGSFKGTATGTYTVDAGSRTIRIEVTDKPGFVPWRIIETALRKAFQ